MKSTTHTSTSFAYVECDIPDGQTLVQWRDARNAEREARRAPRRTVSLPRLPRLRFTW